MLDKKEGNGPDISHLFVALCRAVGIEARYKRALVTNASGMGDGIPDTVERIYAQVKIDGKWLDADPADKRNTKIGQLTIKIQEDRETYSEYKNENTTGVTLADRDTTSSQESSSTVSNFNNSYPPEMQQYLLPVNSTAIQAKANELILGKTTDYEKAKAIYDWVNNNKGYAFYYNTSKGAEGMLNASSGNCCDLAHLLVALFRAAGLPARYKHNTACTFSSGTYGHVWPQVYVDGKWIDADTSSLTDSFGNVAFTANHDNDKVYAILPF
ncbi:MAG: hypothetical protein N2606_00210 [Candidatus Omnitrophica bacterium]|nr:hypothetical protein [Candidatus Omnitrophota bacterium]